MARKKSATAGILAAVGMGVLIIDTKTALSGAAAGINLCIRSIIPSLFPFFFLSSLLTSSITGKSIPCLQPISHAMGIPTGCESLFLTGLIGGYPIGAQSIAQAYKDKVLTLSEAQRMLAFCSNAGPAFLFGIVSGLFQSPMIPWVLWGIHIISAMLVAFLLPGKSYRATHPTNQSNPNIVASLQSALKGISCVCGWVILFQMVMAFCSRWFLWLFPDWGVSLFSGTLELATGIFSLYHIQSPGAAFILASVFLAFGGLCVWMQTITVTTSISGSWYFPGKLMQAVFSFVFSALFQKFIFSPKEQVTLPIWTILIVLIPLSFFFRFRKNNGSNLVTGDV